MIPKISICEPYWNRSEALDEQLGRYAIYYGDRRDLEVVIVDDGSPTDTARPVVERWQGRVEFNIVLRELPVKSQGKDPCVPTNIAVKAARGEFVFLTQGDIHHTKDSITPMLDVYHGCGLSDPVVSALSFDPVTKRWRCDFDTANPAFDWFLIRREHYLDMGGMGEEFRDGYAWSDWDLHAKIRKRGHNYVVCPSVSVFHPADRCSQWREPRERNDKNNALYHAKWPALQQWKVWPVPWSEEYGKPHPIEMKLDSRSVAIYPETVS